MHRERAGGGRGMGAALHKYAQSPRTGGNGARGDVTRLKGRHSSPDDNDIYVKA